MTGAPPPRPPAADGPDGPDGPDGSPPDGGPPNGGSGAPDGGSPPDGVGGAPGPDPGADPSPFTHPDLGVPSSFARALPPDPGRTARADVERLARNDAQRQARSGRGDSERSPRIRTSGRSSRAPQRVRVTSSRMTATARAPMRSVGREIDEQTGVGEVYLRSLLRAQLRLGLSVIAVLALALGTLPLTFALIPRLGTVRVLTVPLPWLLVGVSVYPLLFGVAWWHVVAAERAERDFAAIVESD